MPLSYASLIEMRTNGFVNCCSPNTGQMDINYNAQKCENCRDINDTHTRKKTANKHKSIRGRISAKNSCYAIRCWFRYIIWIDTALLQSLLHFENSLCVFGTLCEAATTIELKRIRFFFWLNICMYALWHCGSCELDLDSMARTCGGRDFRNKNQSSTKLWMLVEIWVSILSSLQYQNQIYLCIRFEMATEKQKRWGEKQRLREQKLNQF